MFIYIKNNIKNTYFETEVELDENYNVGLTYEDYLNGDWVKLNDQQLNFKEEHPTATVEEVFNLKLKEQDQADLILAAKIKKINTINKYDKSNNVNSFIYKGQEMWLSREDRIVLKDRFEREKSNSVEITNLYYNGYAINITPDEGIYLIDSISAYADKCFDNTQKNISLVNACMSVEEVNAIDITAGYPDKLIFE